MMARIRRRRERNGASHRYFLANRRLAPCRSLSVHAFGECLLVDPIQLDWMVKLERKVRALPK